MKILLKASITLAAIALFAGVVWLAKRKEEPGESANDPRQQMFGANALPGFFLAATDVKTGSILYTFTNATSISKIEVLEQIEASDADLLVRDGMMGIQALYANALSPYPGDISNKVTTEAAYQPRLFQITNATIRFTYFLLHANDRLGYGAATKDSVKFKSLVGWFHCAARNEFFKVKLFVPPTTSDPELERLFTSLRCR